MITIAIQIPDNAIAIGIMLEALTRINQIIRASVSGKHSPKLYGGGVVYGREPDGRENWQTIDTVTRSGVGDCEDLAAARAAELRGDGVYARALPVRSGGGWHCIVKLPDGSIEDPSKILGMKSRR